MNKTARFLSFALAAAAPAAAESVFPIVVERDGAAAARGLGVLVAEERLLTAASLAAQGGRLLAPSAAGADPVEVEMLASSAESDLALLAAPGLGGELAVLAKQASGAGRRVYLLFPEGGRREGAMHSLGAAYRFSAAPGERGAGAPLMNNCGQLLAVARAPDAADDPGAAAGVSGILPEVKAFLAAHKTAFAEAGEACPSLAEQVAAREEAEQKLQAEIAEKEKQLEEIRRNENKSEEEAAQLAAELDGLRQSLADGQAATKELQARAEKLARENREKDEALREKDETIGEKDEAIGKLEEQRRRLWAAAAAAAALALLIGAALGFRLRRRRQALRRSDAALAAARADLERSAAVFADAVFVGQGPDGAELRLKIDGSALARSADGRTIGRAAADADYVLTLDSVSRRHARLRATDGKLTIEDLDSLNGVEVDGVPLQPGERRVLEDGARLTLGEAELQVFFLEDGEQ